MDSVGAVGSWLIIAGGSMMLLLALIGRRYATTRTRLGQAAIGLCGIAAGGLDLLTA